MMWILILCAIFMILIFADTAMSSAIAAIELILYNLLPSLFPFFVLTNLLTRSGKISLLTGFLCGYPVGAMACAQLYQSGSLTKEEALRYSMFTSNAGPTFVIGAIGVGMCGSKAIGFLLLAVHLAASLTVAAIAWRRFPKKSSGFSQIASPTAPIPLGTQLTEAITSALKQIAVVCGYVLFFGVILSLLQTAGIKSPVFFSLLEITTGMNCLLSPLGTPASMPALLAILPIASVLLGFSGLSIHAQIIAILNRAGLPARFFVLGKILQAVFAGLYTWLLLQLPFVLEWLTQSFLSINASADLAPSTASFDSIQILFIEATAVFAIYCAALKRKLKRMILL